GRRRDGAGPGHGRHRPRSGAAPAPGGGGRSGACPLQLGERGAGDAGTARRGGGMSAPFSAVVVIHDSGPELARLLDSIARHLDPAPELIVVDTGPADGGAE